MQTKKELNYIFKKIKFKLFRYFEKKKRYCIDLGKIPVSTAFLSLS